MWDYDIHPPRVGGEAADPSASTQPQLLAKLVCSHKLYKLAHKPEKLATCRPFVRKILRCDQVCNCLL